MKCAKCGAENREERKFCAQCGAKLGWSCPQCGFENEPDERFCGGCGHSFDAQVSPPTTIPKLEDLHAQLQSLIPDALAQKYLAAEQQATRENRPITALFADISGFTPLSATESSEAMFQLVQDCFKRLVSIVAGYEGSISGFRGDGLLALFGAPILHENDAERAILAAIDMRSNMHDQQLEVSIGVNTALMTVGEIQTQLHKEYTAYGTDINLAKRLQEAAQPGQILVGAGTHRLTRRAFDFETLTSLNLKGFPQSVTAYAVQQVKTHPEKLRGIEGLRARMIGREREFADLKEAADDLISGRGSIVSIIGEAGLGKSRLALELKEYLKDKDVNWYEGRSVSIGQTVSYWPFLDILRTYLNVSDEDTESDFARKLEGSITDLFPQRWEDILPFLGSLLSIKFGDELDDKLAYFTPEQIRHQTLMRLRDVFIAISHRRPLLLILEDLHWSDDLSLDLVSLLMDELTANPLMLLCIYRPERDHRCWQIGDVASRKCLDRYTEITLKQLSGVQSRQLVESLLTIENLPATTKDMILRKSEGNPFFIEEVIRSLIERDLVYREDDRWKARREIEDIDVPDTIQSVLLSRVDRLEAESKYVLQCASVIGRLFRYRLLDHLARHERDLEEHLTQLEERDLVYEERTVPELEYAFKHALTQEATYQGILEKRRKEFHQRVADGIENLYRERIEEFYEKLANHHRLGGNDEKAIEYLLKSGIKLAGQFASHDALRYFNQAAELMEKSTIPHRKEKAVLYERRGEVLQWIGRWMEAVKDYKEALKWCDDPHDRAEIYQKMGWLECEEIQDKVSAIEHMELGLKELPEDDRSVQRVRLEHDMAWARGVGGVGSPEDSLLRCQQAAKMAEEMGYRRELALLCVSIERYQSLLGCYFDEYGKKAISIAEELSDLPTLAWVYFIVGHTRGIYRSGSHWTQQSTQYYLRAIEIAQRIGDAQIQAQAQSFLGNAYRSLRQADQAIASYEKALDIATGTKTILPLAMASGVMRIYGGRGQEDMVVFTFSRIMRAFVALEIDEESQAWALIMRGWDDIYTVYQRFRDAYRNMGKESEFPNIARKVLEDLLKDVNSRPQRAWYHSELMDLYLELGDMSPAESHAKEVVSIVDEMGRPDCMMRFYPAYLVLGEIEEANGLAYRFITRALTRSWVTVKRDYERYGYKNDLQTLAQQLQGTMADALQEEGITQLLLEPVELGAAGFPELIERFKQDPIAAGWEWLDPAGDCSYGLKNGGYLQITVLPGHDLWRRNYDAPRLLRAISGDFTIQTKISDGSEGRKSGGLLMWKDEGNYLRLEMPSGTSLHWERTVYMGARAEGEFIHPGVHPFEAEEAWLRLERKGDRFTGYVSADGEDWYRCGWADIPMEDPIQVGIHALCPQSQAPATSTRFEYFKIFRAE